MNDERQDTPVGDQRREQLNALMERLQNYPVAETIVHCAAVIGFDPKCSTDASRMDAAFAGAWAHDRTLLYLDRLRSLNEERLSIGEETHRLLHHPAPASPEEVDAAAHAKVMATHYAGKQEVVLNLFCVCIQHIRSLLQVVAAAVGYAIPSDDLDFLDEFRFLRNHFEHWYDRLPGKTNEVGLMTKTLSAEGYRVTGGLKTDLMDRYIVVEPKKPDPVTHIVDVTNQGVARIERIVRLTSSRARELALKRAEEYFTENRTVIPSPDTIHNDPLINVGGFEIENDHI